MELEDFNKCKICEENYYLNKEKVCIRNPSPKIKNCQIYEGINSCL